MSFNGDHVVLARFNRPMAGPFLLGWVKPENVDKPHEFKTVTGGIVRITPVEILSKPVSVFSQPKAYGVFLVATSAHQKWGENGKERVWTPTKDLIHVYSGNPDLPWASTNHSDLIPLYEHMTRKEETGLYEVREFDETYFQV